MENEELKNQQEEKNEKIDANKFKAKTKLINLETIIGEENNVRDTGTENEEEDKKAMMAISTLAENIAEHGLFSPILVSQDGEQYKIIAGHRRFKAYKLLFEKDKKYKEIPAIIREIKDETQEKYIQLAENFSRLDMKEEEKAIEVYKLQEKLNQEEEDKAKIEGRKPKQIGYGTVAKMLGITRSYAQKLYRDGKPKEITNNGGNGSDADKNIKFEIKDVRGFFQEVQPVLTDLENFKDQEVDKKEEIEAKTEETIKQMQKALACLKAFKKETIETDVDLLAEKKKKKDEAEANKPKGKRGRPKKQPETTEVE